MSEHYSELQRELAEQIKRYSLDNIEPHMEEDDENAHFRSSIYQGLGQLGLCGITQPEEYGGADLTVSDLCAVLSELAKYSVSYAVTLSVSTMVQSIISSNGTKEQKEKYLPKLTSGEGIGAFCLSESSSGSDALSMTTTAKKVDGGFELNGTKMWITSGGIAETYIVMAKTDNDQVTTFIVEKEREGLSFGKKEKKMGWRASPTREVILSKCFVPKENVIGKPGHGFKVALSALDKGRVTIGSIAIGLSQRALDESIRYSLGRVQFSQPIFDFQGLQFMMSDMATELEAARSLVTHAASLYDLGKPNQKISSMAKLKATDVAMAITTDAVQIHGGVGYTSEYPVERMMRDAKVLQIVEGTNQIQKVLIARSLKKEYQSS
jgi:butyryl-CoA dehydrogenase